MLFIRRQQIKSVTTLPLSQLRHSIGGTQKHPKTSTVDLYQTGEKTDLIGFPKKCVCTLSIHIDGE